jgi:hypothetical protein
MLTAALGYLGVGINGDGVEVAEKEAENGEPCVRRVSASINDERLFCNDLKLNGVCTATGRPSDGATSECPLTAV